ncbi:hypothetical protein DM01DRAFT_1408611, partial [Hesseltinella vesiculosa]
MAEVSLAALILIIAAISLVFISGLCWCFCCGTCVGQRLLRQTVLHRWTRDTRPTSMVPIECYDDNEDDQWLLTSWNELDDFDEEAGH